MRTRSRHHRRDAERPVGERRDAQPGVRRGHDELPRDVVANSVSQATITETTSETTATVEYLDDSDATLTDADTMTAGLQVNLSVGSNIVKVKVTAPDTTTTETYTVNVFRVAVHRRVQRRLDDEPDLDGKPDRWGSLRQRHLRIRPGLASDGSLSDDTTIHLRNNSTTQSEAHVHQRILGGFPLRL